LVKSKKYFFFNQQKRLNIIVILHKIKSNDYVIPREQFFDLFYAVHQIGIGKSVLLKLKRIFDCLPNTIIKVYTSKIRKNGKLSENEEEILATSTEEEISSEDLGSNKRKKRKVKKIIDTDSAESSQAIDIERMANSEVAIKIKNVGVMLQLNNNIANHLLFVEPFKITYKNIFNMSPTTIKTSFEHCIQTADLNSVTYLKYNNEKIIHIPLLKNLQVNVLEDHPLKDIVIHLNNIANCIDSTKDEFDMKQQLYFNILIDSIIEYYKK
jgi:hypothetical protein